MITGAVLIEGGALRVGNFAFNWVQKPNNSPSTPYSFTATTFIYGGKVFKYVGSNLVGGFCRNVSGAQGQQPGEAELGQTISATKQ